MTPATIAEAPNRNIARGGWQRIVGFVSSKDKRTKVTLDLDRERYQHLRASAFELNAAHAEILRALLDEHRNNAQLAKRIAARIESGEVTRAKGGAAGNSGD